MELGLPLSAAGVGPVGEEGIRRQLLGSWKNHEMTYSPRECQSDNGRTIGDRNRLNFGFFSDGNECHWRWLWTNRIFSQTQMPEWASAINQISQNSKCRRGIDANMSDSQTSVDPRMPLQLMCENSENCGMHLLIVWNLHHRRGNPYPCTMTPRKNTFLRHTYPIGLVRYKSPMTITGLVKWTEAREFIKPVLAVILQCH
jgi:hypothetical protein